MVAKQTSIWERIRKVLSACIYRNRHIFIHHYVNMFMSVRSSRILMQYIHFICVGWFIDIKLNGKMNTMYIVLKQPICMRMKPAFCSSWFCHFLLNEIWLIFHLNIGSTQYVSDCQRRAQCLMIKFVLNLASVHQASRAISWFYFHCYSDFSEFSF